jgi:hypothetical protein
LSKQQPFRRSAYFDLMARRANGEGTIYRRKDGRFEAAILVRQPAQPAVLHQAGRGSTALPSEAVC